MPTLIWMLLVQRRSLTPCAERDSKRGRPCRLRVWWLAVRAPWAAWGCAGGAVASGVGGAVRGELDGEGQIAACWEPGWTCVAYRRVP